MEGKWMYNLYGNEIWSGKEFDAKEEAIKYAKEEIRENGLEGFVTSFEVGQIVGVSVSGVDVDYILENVAENTTCDCGEVGEDYLCNVENEHRDELEKQLNEVLFAWIKKHDYEPNFFKIENEEVINL